MHLQRMANRRQRGMDLAHGADCPDPVINEPNVDFAQLARSMGPTARDRSRIQNDLRPALLRAVARVEKGEVALLDTLTQPALGHICAERSWSYRWRSRRPR